MKCSACRRDCRVTKRAIVAMPDGGVRNARVCMHCFDGALHIVPAIVTQGVAIDPRKENKRDAKTLLGAAIKKLRNTAKAYADTDEVMVTGFESAIDILEAGDF